MLGWQGNVDALLQLGDSHWYGRGAERNWARAAVLYQTASKFRNAQALFNLGFMHEFGAGLPQVPQTCPPTSSLLTCSLANCPKEAEILTTFPACLYHEV